MMLESEKERTHLPARLEGRRHCRQGSLCFCDGGGVVVVVVVWSPLLSSPLLPTGGVLFFLCLSCSCLVVHVRRPLEDRRQRTTRRETG